MYYWLTVFSPRTVTFSLGSLSTNWKYLHSQNASWNDFRGPSVQAFPHPSGVSLNRARSLFHPLLPSACYAGYLSTTECYPYKAWPRNLSAISTTRNVACMYAHLPMHTAEMRKKYLDFLKVSLNRDKYCLVTKKSCWVYFNKKCYTNCVILFKCTSVKFTHDNKTTHKQCQLWQIFRIVVVFLC